MRAANPSRRRAGRQDPSFRAFFNTSDRDGKIPRKGQNHLHILEWIDRKTAQKCITIFPPPSGGVKVHASGRTIVIKPVEAFSESTTYHIEINTSLNDLHGNSIGTPFHFFFSTGATVGNGKVFGCVSSSDLKGLQQPKVALFALGAAPPPDTLLFGPPSYVVQTDSSGGFVFDHIRKGGYEIVAFADAKGNNRFVPGKDAAFGPEEKHIRWIPLSAPCRCTR